MGPSTPLTKSDRRRFELLGEIGCLACWLEQNAHYPEPTKGPLPPAQKQCGPLERHHVLTNGKRTSHSETVGLGKWHHQGSPLDASGHSAMYLEFGPSLALHGRAFTNRYGEARQLVELQNMLLMGLDPAFDPIGKPRCTVRGCHKIEKAGGLCGMHYERRRAGTVVDRPSRTLNARAKLERHQKGREDECWPWPAARDKDGYGFVKVGGKQQRVPRVSYELYNGPIPDGKMVLHTCDNPPCWNPKHLFLGDAQANTDDMVAKGRQTIRRGTRHHYAQLTEAQVIEARRSLEPTNVLAKKYGVRISCLASARHGKTWAHLPEPPQTSEEARECRRKAKSAATSRRRRSGWPQRKLQSRNDLKRKP